MSGNMLSQDEIDALLRGEALSNSESETQEVTSALDISQYLTEIEKDAIGEIGNISFGSSATALSTLLRQKVEITTPQVSMIDTSKLADEFPHPYVAIEVKYTVGFTGYNLLILKQSDAAIIADLMLGGDGSSPNPDMEEIHLSAVQEAMNQMMGSAATSMSTVFNKKIDISPPMVKFLNILEGQGTETIPDQNLLVKVSFQLKIGSLIDSQIMQILPVPFVQGLVDELLTIGQDSNDLTKTNDSEPASDISVANTFTTSHREIMQEQNPKKPTQKTSSKPMINNQPTIQTASFMEFTDTQVTQAESRNLDLLLDIPLQVSVELGRTKRTIKDILELGSGSIIELDKLAGEPVDILVNNRLIAKGEVVVIDEKFGVRVTDIMNKSERIKHLNE